MKFRRRKPRETIDINLVSLIDVVFILLLFFVVTTTFTRETQLRVDLPQAVTGASADDADKKHVDITINADGVYSVNDTLLADSKLETLIDALQKESAGDTSLPLSISADGKTPHQAVITAMDAAGKLGFAHLRMTTVEAASAN
ncbi:MAG: ExbD/TolR family protein [Pseudomonas sp.]|uniref:ExbD/TolR family protein n=1 Tax=Pseudomonas sp. TaxID=306 RepID=UPI003D6FBB6D